MSDAKVLTVNATGEVEELNLQPVLDGKMEITGFPTDADGNYFCTLTYNETTRTVTITPTGAAFDIFVGGTKYTFTGAQSIVHGAQQGGHFIYFDATGTLVTSQVPWDILSHVPTCYVFRDAISGLSIPWEERHHANRDLYWHANQHYNEGTKARSGFAISGYILNNSTANTSITYAIASGIVDDEDIAVTTEALADNGPYTVMRRSGAVGDWVIDRTPVLPFLISGSDAAYNQFTGATWQMTASANNQFLNYYVLATTALPSTSVTPASKNQYILIPGQVTFSSLALAQAELISAIQWGDIPFQEVAPLYKITFQRGNGYATTGRVRIAAVSRIIGTYVQVTQATNPNHGALLGLTDDSHPQYPILSSGTVAPTSTPDRIGALYVDTAAPALYVGKGTVDATDWFSTKDSGGGGGGGPVVISNKTAAYTVISTDFGTIINCTANTFTVSLTAAATIGAGFRCWVWNTSNTSSHVITVDPAGTETIDGAATLLLRRGEGFEILCNGTNWQTAGTKKQRLYSENAANNVTRAAATGSNSVALGNAAAASGTSSVAFGDGATASGVSAIVLGTGRATTQDSVALAITDNTTTYGANTNVSAIAIGYLATASGQNSVAIGSSASASGLNSTVIGGNGSLASGSNSTVIGTASGVVSGNYSSTISGHLGRVDSSYSVTLGGLNLFSNVDGKVVCGTSASISVGACQTGITTLVGNTTNATPVVLTSTGYTVSATNQLVLLNNQSMAVTGRVIAQRKGSESTTSTAMWTFNAVIRRGANAASTALVAAVTPTLIAADTDTSTWTVAITADTTNGALAVSATGEAAKNILWVCTLESTEVIYA